MAKYVITDNRHTENGTICTVTINNEAKYNSLNSTAFEELIAIFRDLKTNKELAAVIFTGAGTKAFIGGANIYEMAELTPSTAREFITRIHDLCTAIRELHVPVIARINGVCFGAGMELSAVCDLVIADANATFAMPEVHVGIPSVVEAAVLPRILGVGLARDLVMTGRTLTAAEAKEAGFVQRLAEPGQLDNSVEEAIEQILKGGREAIRLQKLLCNAWEEENMSTSIQMGIDIFAKSFETEEPKKLLGAFVNRKR
ncbi:enoyl-CoA hydratase [Sneathiella glossodoripedis]|uniref:enoyl-CoA hydratase n=1 Tax=Sneathiella glossodoripedis TaxID=418853 RepID=UPI0004719EC6|nr:enoyl-CoA hydratase [Sneathiella glossodoripedis]